MTMNISIIIAKLHKIGSSIETFHDTNSRAQLLSSWIEFTRLTNEIVEASELTSSQFHELSRIVVKTSSQMAGIAIDSYKDDSNLIVQLLNELGSLLNSCSRVISDPESVEINYLIGRMALSIQCASFAQFFCYEIGGSRLEPLTSTGRFLMHTSGIFDHIRVTKVDRSIFARRHRQLENCILTAIGAIRIGLRAMRRTKLFGQQETAYFHLLLSYFSLRVTELKMVVRGDYTDSAAEQRIQRILTVAAAALPKKPNQSILSDIAALTYKTFNELRDFYRGSSLRSLSWGIWISIHKREVPQPVADQFAQFGGAAELELICKALSNCDQRQIDRILASFLVGSKVLHRNDISVAFTIAHLVPYAIFGCIPGVSEVYRTARDSLLVDELSNQSDQAMCRRLEYINPPTPLSSTISTSEVLSKLKSISNSTAVVFVFKAKHKVMFWIFSPDRRPVLIPVERDMSSESSARFSRMRSRVSFTRKADDVREAVHISPQQFSERDTSKVRNALGNCTTVRWFVTDTCIGIRSEKIIGPVAQIVTVHTTLLRIPELAIVFDDPMLNTEVAGWLPPSLHGDGGTTTLASLIWRARSGEDDTPPIRNYRITSHEVEEFYGISYGAVELIALRRRVTFSGAQIDQVFLRERAESIEVGQSPDLGHYVGHGAFFARRPLDGQLLVSLFPPRDPLRASRSFWRRLFARGHMPESSFVTSIDARPSVMTVAAISSSLNHLARPVVWLGGCCAGQYSPDARGDPAGFVQAFLDNGTRRLIAPLCDVDDFWSSLLASVFYFFESVSESRGYRPEVVLNEAKRYLCGDWGQNEAARTWIIECLCESTPTEFVGQILAPVDIALNIATLSKNGVNFEVTTGLMDISRSADFFGCSLVEPFCESSSVMGVDKRWQQLRAAAENPMDFRREWRDMVKEFASTFSIDNFPESHRRLADTTSAFVCFA